MEFVDGLDLYAFITQYAEDKSETGKTRIVSEKILAAIFKQIMDAISYCHYKNIVHK